MKENIFLVIPSLNPDEKLSKTVDGMLAAGFDKIIIVNDGSDDEHLKYFPKASEKITVIHRKRNHGKGAALKVAFRHILKNYPDTVGAVTVDGDGQHTPEDATAVAHALEEHKNSAILGCRDFSGVDVPKRSRMGNRITSRVFRLLCGMRLSDTQTGLRAFPLSMFPLLLSVKGDRFEYETNMLLKFGRSGVDIKEIPIKTLYIDENASSHFNPVKDSLRIYKFILLYALSSLISFGVDIAFFYILSALLTPSLKAAAVVVATLLARAVSSAVNYFVNRRAVFGADGRISKSIFKYYALAIPQMLVSAGAVYGLSLLLSAKPWLATVIKIVVDTVLFFLSYRIQQTWVFSENSERTEQTKRKPLSVKCVVKRTLLSVGTALLAVVITVYSAGLMICYGPSESLKNMLVIMAKEASATKWAPGLFLSEDKIQKIISDSEKVTTDTITADGYASNDQVDEWANAEDGMKLIFLNETKYKGYLLLVRDPKRVSVGVSSENFASATEGKRIFDVVEKYGAAAAINGGEFLDTGGMGKGSAPMGLTYSSGKNVWNDGLRRTFVGFDSNDRLVVSEGMTKKQADELGIRDAVSFQTGNVLIEQKGEEIKLYKADSDTGTAQRTAIGQRTDGTVIMLVTDGRSVDSIGATRNDVIDLMVEYGAVNAAMLDGGSSAMMFYRDYCTKYGIDSTQLDEYQLKGLVNRYKAFTKPRKIPTYFIVSEGE